MKKVLHLGMLLVLLLSVAGFVMPASASTPQNYTVWVGSENTSMGVSIMSFFPHTVKLHVGDSITWKVNTHEIHTVTFLAGGPLPELLIPAPPNMASPLQINPKVAFPMMPTNGLYNGSTYVNSGVMSTDPGFIKTFKLTFTKQGVFNYVCVVHGEAMSGTINVVASSVAVPTPTQVQAQSQAELKAAWLKVPTVLAKAQAQVVPPVKNPDGTLTHTITLGYSSGDIMIMKFFPSQETVSPGDTVIWKMSATNMAPHTVTFYNGRPDQPFVIIVQTQNGPVALLNPAILFPSKAVMQNEPLNGTDYFNSGIMQPGSSTFSLKVGNASGTLSYDCALHDTSGMTASLFVEPRTHN